MRDGIDAAPARHGRRIHQAQDVTTENGILLDQAGQIAKAHVFARKTRDEAVQNWGEGRQGTENTLQLLFVEQLPVLWGKFLQGNRWRFQGKGFPLESQAGYEFLLCSAAWYF